MINSPLIWVVIVNWNGLADTLSCLESLRGLHYVRYRVVVVDNASSDGSVAGLRRVHDPSEIDLIEAGRNLGYAGGNNLGIRHALDRGGDFILLLNNDVTVDPMLLDELVAAAEQYPAVGCFGPWIFYMHDRERVWFTRSEWDPAAGAFTMPGQGSVVSDLVRKATPTEYVCGAALFFRASMAREIGLLDERFFLVYEDSDWCFRARRAGFGSIAVPTARVWHKVGTAFGSEASPLRTYFSSRNNLLWAEKHLSRRERWQVLRNALHRMPPRFGVVRTSGIPAHKALLWACIGYARDWARKLRDPQAVAHRRGVADYILRRFGDCPPEIRRLARAWSTARDTTAAPHHLTN